MFPFWVFKDNLETSVQKPHVPLPENWKPLDFGMVFSSMKEAKTSGGLFVGEIILILDEKEGSGTYVVKSIDPLELVEIGERTEAIQRGELKFIDEMGDPLRKYYKTADDEEPDCGARCYVPTVVTIPGYTPPQPSIPQTPQPPAYWPYDNWWSKPMCDTTIVSAETHQDPNVEITLQGVNKTE